MLWWKWCTDTLPFLPLMRTQTLSVVFCTCHTVHVHVHGLAVSDSGERSKCRGRGLLTGYFKNFAWAWLFFQLIDPTWITLATAASVLYMPLHSTHSLHSGLRWVACRSTILNARIAPDVWLAPCMAASAISHIKGLILWKTCSLWCLHTGPHANSQNEESKQVLYRLCSLPTGKTALLQVVQIQLLSLHNERRDFHNQASSTWW